MEIENKRVLGLELATDPRWVEMAKGGWRWQREMMEGGMEGGRN
jgi:hypothetical protein